MIVCTIVLARVLLLYIQFPDDIFREKTLSWKLASKPIVISKVIVMCMTFTSN